MYASDPTGMGKKLSLEKAVCEMPLFRLKKVAEAPVKTYGKSGKKGPLSGIKVLDLTHIIAGPAPVPDLLAEQGAEVTLNPTW